MDLVQQRVVALDDLVLPDVPEARKVVPEAHRAFIVGIRVVSGRQTRSHLEWAIPICVEVCIDVSGWMPRHLLEGCCELVIVDVLNSDFEVHAAGPLRGVEQPASVITAIFKRYVGDRTASERHSPGYDTLFHRGRHRRHGRNGHFHVWAGREHRRTHPVLVRLVLKQNPLAYTALAVIVTCAKSGIVARLLERVVQISVDKELDAFLDGNFVCADRPVDLRLFAGVEAIDIDVGAVAPPESFPKLGFVSERAFQNGDVAEREKLLRASRCRVAAKGPNRVFLVSHERSDDRQTLGTCAADYKDFGRGMDGHHYLLDSIDRSRAIAVEPVTLIIRVTL